MSNSVLLPQPAIDLLAAAFPGEPPGDITSTFGGFSNLTVAAAIGGRPVVVKAAALPQKRADLRREARVLGLLRDSGLPVPPLLALVEDETWSVEALGRMPGENALRLLDGPPEALGRLYAELGALLARLHALPPPASSPDLDLALRAAAARAALPLLGLEGELSAALDEALGHGAWRPAQGELRLVHGDAGLHNLLWEGAVTALLDWEWAGLASPLFDLGWLWWTMQFRRLPGALWQTLLGSYRAGGAPALAAGPGAMRALVLGQIAGILARVAGQEAPTAEWLRRLRWTLTLEFPDGELV